MNNLMFLLCLAISTSYGNLSKIQLKNVQYQGQDILGTELEGYKNDWEFDSNINPDTFICIGSPKCPEVDGYLQNNHEQGFDFEKPKKDNTLYTGSQKTDDHDKNSKQIYYDGIVTDNSPNIPFASHDQSEFNIIHLLQNYLRDTPSTRVHFQIDTKNPNFDQNLKELPADIVTDDVFVNNGESYNSPLLINTNPYYISIKLDDSDKIESSKTPVELNKSPSESSEFIEKLGDFTNLIEKVFGNNKGDESVEISAKVNFKEPKQSKLEITGTQYGTEDKEKKSEEHTEVKKLKFDVMELMNYETFLNFLADLGEKYLDSLITVTNEFIEKEIAKKLTDYLEALTNILKDKFLHNEEVTNNLQNLTGHSNKTEEVKKFNNEAANSEQLYAKHEKESQLNTIKPNKKILVNDRTDESYNSNPGEIDVRYNNDELSLSTTKENNENNKYKSKNESDSNATSDKHTPINLTETKAHNEEDYLNDQSEDKIIDQKDSQNDNAIGTAVKY